MPEPRPRRLLLRALLAGASLLPRGSLYPLGRTLGLLADFLGLRHARTTAVNVGLAFPDLPTRARRALARRSLVADACLALELPATWQRGPERLLRTVDGREAAARLGRAEQAGRGVLLLVPHLGNWELLCLWLQALAPPDRPFTALYRPLRDPTLDRWLHAARERTGARLVATDGRGLRVLLRALRAGGVVAVLPDQVPPPMAAVAAPFFGRDALTMTLVRALVRRHDPAVLTATALRTAHGHLVRLLDVDPGLGDTDRRRAAAALNRSLEACIALAPEQYQWGYKRWRHAPGAGGDYYVIRRQRRE